MFEHRLGNSLCTLNTSKIPQLRQEISGSLQVGSIEPIYELAINWFENALGVIFLSLMAVHIDELWQACLSLILPIVAVWVGHVRFCGY